MSTVPKVYHADIPGCLKRSSILFDVAWYASLVIPVAMIPAKGTLNRMQTQTFQLKGWIMTFHLSSFSSGFRTNALPYSKK